ncbi:hypothetical protein ACTFIW_006695 [Dictyostelium discoideum]
MNKVMKVKLNKRTKAHLEERVKRRFNALSQGLEIGNISKASRDNGLTRDTVRYYYRDLKKNKVRGKHGGTRKKLILIYNTDWSKLYFLDECSFSSRELTRKKAVGPIGKPVYVHNEASISETYNGFFMINMSGCKYKIRDETNTTEDFVKYLKEVLESGFIVTGSILVMDNAPIHGGVKALQIIEQMLDQYSVKLVFLPTYCPERNPIERFFGYIKNHFYRRRSYKKDFLDEIVDSINSAKQNPELFMKFYRQSLAF